MSYTYVCGPELAGRCHPSHGDLFEGKVVTSDVELTGAGWNPKKPDAPAKPKTDKSDSQPTTAGGK